MEKNIGKVDRSIRIVLGAAIVLAGIYYNYWLGIIGLVPLMTGLVEYCPTYALFKISTKEAIPAKEKAPARKKK